MQVLLTVEQLATYLRKSVSSVRSDATRNPQSLPPICRLPGTKRLLWRLEDVEQWLAEHVATVEASPVAQKKRRGRPTKSEQVASQWQAAGQSKSKTPGKTR